MREEEEEEEESGDDDIVIVGKLLPLSCGKSPHDLGLLSQLKYVFYM